MSHGPMAVRSINWSPSGMPSPISPWFRGISNRPCRCIRWRRNPEGFAQGWTGSHFQVASSRARVVEVVHPNPGSGTHGHLSPALPDHGFVSDNGEKSEFPENRISREISLTLEPPIWHSRRSFKTAPGPRESQSNHQWFRQSFFVGRHDLCRLSGGRVGCPECRHHRHGRRDLLLRRGAIRHHRVAAAAATSFLPGVVASASGALVTLEQASFAEDAFNDRFYLLVESGRARAVGSP